MAKFIYEICSPLNLLTFEGFMQCTTVAFQTWTLDPNYSYSWTPFKRNAVCGPN